MRRFFTILFLIPLIALGQTFNPTAIPLNTDFLAPDRGAHLWINRDAPFGTIDIPVNDAPQQMVDGYFRFLWTRFFTGTGSDSTINWSFFRARMGEFTAKRMGIKFRIMANGSNIGNPPSDNFNGLVNYAGGWNGVPEFLHNLQQAESNSANRDFLTTFGGQYPTWVPNTNSPQFQRWVRKFSQQLRNYIDTAVINGWPLRHAIRIYDLGFYGCFSEQHSACLCNTMTDGNIPAGARPNNNNGAGLIEIVDAQLDAMGGNPNWKYVIPFNALDAVWLGHTLNPVAYGQYLIDHPDSISFVNDHLGANEGYDHDYWENNNRLGSRGGTPRQIILNNRWRFSPHGGEPVGWGQPADRSAIPQYVQQLHLSGFGNGNLDHIAANGQDDNGWPTEANNIRTASRLAGYRLRITGGGANVGASLTINLNWLNEGNAPVYFPWTVQYLIKNGAGTTVSTLTSNFQVRYFQPSGAATTHSQNFGIPAIPAGTYGLYVKVVDPNGYRNPMPLAITPRQSDDSYFLANINLSGGTNQNPVANAGPNQSITSSSTTLTSTGSSDPDGTIASFLWTRVSGPNTPTIVTPTGATTSVTGLIAGTYVFNLTVTDNLGATGSDQIQVIVNGNQPPVANAGPNQAITLPTSAVTVNGSASTDDIAIASYLWTQTNGPNTANIVSPTSFTSTINGLIQGSYSFRLRVTDASGLFSTDDMIVTVNSGNQAPIANAGANITINFPVSSTTLNGSASTDDFGITEYLWTQVGGPITATITNPSSVSTTVTGLTTAGPYIFRLRVTDASGLTNTDDVQVTVNFTNTAPVANAGPNQTVTLPINFVQLNGTGSTDNVGIVSYLWTKQSGPATFSLSFPNNAITNAESLQVGVYVFRLTVTDGGGLTHFDDVTVTVLPLPNTAPIAVAGNNQSITLPVSSTTVNGSGSSDDLAITQYLWTQVSGPTTATIATPGNVSTNISAMTIAGNYVFRLRVDDQLGLFDTDDITITVNAAANNAPVAVAGPPQTIQLPTSSVTLNGSGSTDDVAVTGYAWAMISGPASFTIVSPTSASTSVTNLIEGIYFFELQVSDAGGLTDMDIIMITVLRAPDVPRPVNDNHSLFKGPKFLPRN